MSASSRSPAYVCRAAGARRSSPPMRKVYGTLVALMVLAGCGFNSGPSFEIGLKRVAVNLSFKDQTKALPPLRKTIFIPAPAPEIGSFVTQVVPNLFPTSNPTPTPQFPKIAPACPTAPPNSHPVLPATVFVYSAPTPGVYTAHNTGTFSISSGALSVKAAYPPQSSFTVGPSTTSTDNSNPASGP